MSKGQKRNGHEQKKPKQDKPEAAVARPTLTALHKRAALPIHTKKK